MKTIGCWAPCASTIPNESMKRFLPLLICGLSLCACGKIELPDESNHLPSGPIKAEDTLSVAQARTCPIDTIVAVKGYIVGYVSGSSITTSSIFDYPEDEPNTNMLLADSPDETDYLECLPVRLENSNNYGFRNCLNMFDYPENYQRLVLLIGSIDNYFRVKGIKRVYSYEWLPETSAPVFPPSVETDTPNLVDRDSLLEGR